MTHACAETHFPHSHPTLYLYNSICIFKRRPVERTSCPCLVPRQKEIAAKRSRCHAQMIDSSNHFRKLRVEWHPDTGAAKETDGTIASPWPGLHFLVLSGARVSVSGIWVRWSAFFIHSVARKNSIHLETKRASSCLGFH